MHSTKCCIHAVKSQHHFFDLLFAYKLINGLIHTPDFNLKLVDRIKKYQPEMSVKGVPCFVFPNIRNPRLLFEFKASNDTYFYSVILRLMRYWNDLKVISETCLRG